MMKMIVLPNINFFKICISCLVLFCSVIAASLAAPMHKPSYMPSATAESVGMSSKGLAKIDKLFQNKIDAGLIQGGVTIVARKGKVVHFSTHGKMDVAKNRSMEPDALYHMASSSKPLIAAAAMIAVDDGLIDVDDPVSAYIPEFAEIKVAIFPDSAQGIYSKKGKNFKNGSYRLVPVDQPVTIHHLLTHTSGIPYFSLGPKSKKSSKEEKWSIAEYARKVAGSPLAFQPGTEWGYSNDALDVIARVIEVSSGKPFIEFIQEKLLDPLNMKNTYFNLPEEKGSKRLVLEGKDSKVALEKYFWPGLGLSSSAEDYLHFNQMLLNGGELFGRRILSEESVRIMSSDHVGDIFSQTNDEDEKGQLGYGWGYQVRITLNPEEAQNNRGKGSFGWGGMGGTASWADPENEIAAVVMLQQENGKGFAKAILDSIIE